MPGFAVYAVCKAGMIGFTRSAPAIELAEHDIRVNCISPYYTVTPGNRGNRTGPVDPSTWPDSSPDWAKVDPSAGRASSRSARAVVWLCSRMAAYVTGINAQRRRRHVGVDSWLAARPRGWLDVQPLRIWSPTN